MPTRGSVIDTYETPTDAVIAPDGKLIVATQGGLGSSSSIWTTSDGDAWQEHPFSDEGSGSRIDAMATSGDMIIAVGTGPAVWTSIDGRSWTVQSRPPGAAEWLTDVAYDPMTDRFVVVGPRADGRAGVWSTPDGRNWTSAVISDGPGSTRSVAVGGPVIAIGGELGALGEQDAAIWSSHDGVTWRYLTLGGRGSTTAVDVGMDGTTVAVIHRYFDDARGFEIWTGRLGRDPQ